LFDAFQGAAAGDNPAHPLQVGGSDQSFGQHGLDLGALAGIPHAVGVIHQHRLFGFLKVAQGRFAAFIGVREHTDDIILDLKGPAEADAVFVKFSYFGCGGVSQDGAHGQGAGKCVVSGLIIVYLVYVREFDTVEFFSPKEQFNEFPGAGIKRGVHEFAQALFFVFHIHLDLQEGVNGHGVNHVAGNDRQILPAEFYLRGASDAFTQEDVHRRFTAPQV